MAQTRAKKESLVDELKKLFERASILVFVNFHGLSVAKTRKLRGELRQKEINYRVAKKTLLKRALAAMGYADMPLLEGEVGVAAGYSEAVEPPQVLAKFSKEHKELQILGGLYENAFVGADVIKRLAAIPSREMLLAQLAFALSQPMASLARVLKEVSKK